MQYYAQVKARIKAVADLDAADKSGMGTAEYEKRLFDINRFFTEYAAPDNFDDDSEENAVIRAENGFEATCAMLEANGVHNPSALSTMQFYARLEHFKRMTAQAKEFNEKSKK